MSAKVLKNLWSTSCWKHLSVISLWEERPAHICVLGTCRSHFRASKTIELIVYTCQSTSVNQASDTPEGHEPNKTEIDRQVDSPRPAT